MNRVGGQFQQVADGQKVRRLQLPVRQFTPVQEGQNVERGQQQFACFLGTQGAPAQDLSERLVGMFHHDKDVFMPHGAVLAHRIQAQQVGMGQRGGRFPQRQLTLRG